MILCLRGGGGATCHRFFFCCVLLLCCCVRFVSSPLVVALTKGAGVETLAEKYVREFAGMADLFGDTQFDLDYPELYERRNAEWVAVPHTFKDVYELTRFYAGRHQLSKGVDDELEAVVLVTCGWGAPLNDDGEVGCAPSEHPKRRRLSLLYGAGRDGSLFSVMMFQDGDEVAGASGLGALYEAMETVGVSAWKREWVFGLFNNYAAYKAALDHVAGADDDATNDLEENLIEWYAHRVAYLMEVLGHSDLLDDIGSDNLPESQEITKG